MGAGGCHSKCAIYNRSAGCPHSRTAIYVLDPLQATLTTAPQLLSHTRDRSWVQAAGVALMLRATLPWLGKPYEAVIGDTSR